MGPFLQSNREERFFCAVLLHVLLTPCQSQRAILDLLSEAAGASLAPSDLECYVEVAALRDAWRLLGDPKQWTPDLYVLRRDMLHALVAVPSACNYAGSRADFEGLVQEHAFFWTSGAKKKLVSPGRWPLAEIESTQILGGPANLKALKWAFNSKPDLLLLSGGDGLIIEAKAASDFGVNAKTGFDQQRVQQLIAELFPVLTDHLVQRPLRRITLTNKPGSGSILWEDVARLVTPADIGTFACDALRRAAQVMS
jgi:hypothetical protein